MNQLPTDADAWILAGQSNMAGSGGGEAYDEPSESVWLYSLRDEWGIATEPFTAGRYEAVDEAFAIMRGEREKHFADPEYRRHQAATFPSALIRTRSAAGLGLSFGKAMAEYTGNPIGLVFCAKGDTRMEEWVPDYGGHPSMALYRATVRRARKVNRPIKGILWYQGESDTFDGKARLYSDRMQQLVAAFRRDLNQPDLPFFYVQIATCVQQTEEELPDWNRVQETQRRLEPVLAPGGLCAAVDLPLHDGIHLATAGLKRLGRRLARLVRRRLYGDIRVEVGPRPGSVKRVAGDPRSLKIQFESVNERLLPEDRVAGFSIHAPGSDRNLACAALVLPGSRSTVIVKSYGPIAEGSSLWYGKGLMPFCNLVDAADLGAPVFGPWPIPEESAGSLGCSRRSGPVATP